MVDNRTFLTASLSLLEYEDRLLLGPFCCCSFVLLIGGIGGIAPTIDDGVKTC